MVVGTKNDETIESGCVLTQNASVGSIVAINYSVEVVISAGIEQYEVPYMVGILKEEAVTALESSFTYEIVEEFDSVIEKGYVTKQSIDGGVEVDKGTLITLTISKGRNPEIEYEFEGDKMPNLVGLTLVEAMELCEKSGIKLVVTSYEYSTEYDGMCVLEQNTDEGAVIKADTTVEIVLSKGAQIFKVPSILYLTEEETIAKLEERELKYKLLYEENETVAEGCVASQSIASGTVIDKDDVIEVIISTGPPKFEMVDVVGMTEAEAITTLQELGLVVTVEYEYDNSTQSGTVISQSEDVGTKVNKGYEITVVICSEEELITVPNVTGKAYESAKAELESVGFVVEKNEIYSDSISKNVVISQTPRGGSGQKNGVKVVLTVSLGKQVVSDSVTEEPTLSVATDETEKATEKETEKATHTTTQKPTETSKKEESTEAVNKILVPAGCEFYDCSTGVTLQGGETFVGELALNDELRTRDYIYYYEGDGWSAITIDKTKTEYEELLGTIMDKPLIQTWHMEVDEDFTNINFIGTYQDCVNIKIAPKIPTSVISMDCTFDGCTSLVSVSNIPESVTSMDWSFANCTSLKEAPVIPSSVTGLTSTFEYCSSLLNAPIIPEGVVNMRYTFRGCTALIKAPDIPDSVTVMDATFDGCSSLKEVSNIPLGVTSLYFTFSDCSSLEDTPAIPLSVTSMWGTFSGCSSLKIVPNIPNGVINMERTFQSCTSLEKTPIIPSSVTNMNGTFYGCSKLTTVSEIPKSVVNMSFAFGACLSLTGNICINANPSEYDYCFDGVDFTAQNLTLSGTSTMLDELRATGTN